jgi:hypothetical protein
VLKRDLAQFVVKHPISIKYFQWLADMTNGDESFFSTLATLRVDEDGTITQDVHKNTDQGQVPTQHLIRNVHFVIICNRATLAYLETFVKAINFFPK